ncbi:MAG: hypothetical protein ACRD1J_02015 [Terriglobia bacterium]
MKFATLLALFSTFAFACLIQTAHAGVIRYAGKQLARGAAGAAQIAAEGGVAAAAGASSAGHSVVNTTGEGMTIAKGAAAAAAGGAIAGGAAAGSAVANAATHVGSALKSTPGKVWHFIW